MGHSQTHWRELKWISNSVFLVIHNEVFYEDVGSLYIPQSPKQSSRLPISIIHANSPRMQIQIRNINIHACKVSAPNISSPRETMGRKNCRFETGVWIRTILPRRCTWGTPLPSWASMLLHSWHKNSEINGLEQLLSNWSWILFSTVHSSLVYT